MGTNYYWYGKEHAPCPHCGRANEQERLHIGKSSAGWVFSLHVIPDSGLNSLDDWRERMEQPDSVIRDEYGDIIPPVVMLKAITDRRGRGWDDKNRAWEWDLSPYRDEADFHKRNYSQRGPNGLLRSVIDGQRCIGHGDGTWDLHAGEFS